MKIEQIKVSVLNPAEYNPRRWDAKSVKDLTESIKRFGLVDPIIANKAPGRENVVIGGHFRLHIAKELGYTEVPVYYVDIPDINKEMELNLRLNRNVGDWDWNLLANFDETMLVDSGFTTQEIDKAMGLGANDEDDFDAEEEVAKIVTPKAKVGDVYQLGEHRLMCGDSTNKAHVTTLMDGKRADMVFTDPPYNINYSGRGKKTSNTILNDAMSPEEFRHFLGGAFTSMRDATKDDAPAYVCYASRTHREFEDTLNLAGYQVRQQIIWVKAVASMGWGDYRWKHEPILYVVKTGSTTEFFGDRAQYTEWKDDPSDDELLKRVRKMIEKDEQGDSTVWRLKRDSNYDHPTQKPLALIKIALRNSSKRGALVLDLFGGSGSTLIAAEQYGRTCYAMELDPKYVDVIIKRYEKATGLTATKIA